MFFKRNTRSKYPHVALQAWNNTVYDSFRWLLVGKFQNNRELASRTKFEFGENQSLTASGSLLGTAQCPGSQALVMEWRSRSQPGRRWNDSGIIIAAAGSESRTKLLFDTRFMFWNPKLLFREFKVSEYQSADRNTGSILPRGADHGRCVIRCRRPPPKSSPYTRGGLSAGTPAGRHADF